MRTLTASWDAWLAAYELYYKALPAPGASNACPNCADERLRVAFTGQEAQRVGYASFWCDGCLVGIHLSRCPVPEGVPMDSIHTPVELRATRVPNYTLIWPDEDE